MARHVTGSLLASAMFQGSQQAVESAVTRSGDQISATLTNTRGDRVEAYLDQQGQVRVHVFRRGVSAGTIDLDAPRQSDDMLQDRKMAALGGEPY
ncbi:MAG TPA: hypothetical protein VJ247_00115 [Gaiella sp.]|jgi:hypothetical protein|nr:hypothetical protein [Gaiella sp.]